MRRSAALLCVAVLLTGAAVFVSTTPTPVLATAVPAKPNIVLIVSDDQSLDSLAAMPFLTSKPGGHWFEFTNAFDNTPLCCPSRATLFSGLYPHHHGVEHNTGGAFDDDSTVATWLQAAGYRTGLAGKYLNDYPFGASFIPPGWSDWFANVGTTGHYNYTMNDNGTNVSFGNAESDYHTDVVARRAKEFIETSGGQPFFLYAAPVAPHPPLVPPPRYSKTRITTTRPPNFNEADVSDKPAWVATKPLLTSQEASAQDASRAKQYRMVMAVDDLVRTVRQALADAGVLDETVIIFQTDNGTLFGEHRHEGKSCVYEECVRTPLFVRVPWLDGGVDDRMVSSIDIAPTLADLAGVAPPDPVDGTSLRPLLEGAPVSWRSSLLLEHHAQIPSRPDFWAIRNHGWKYVELATGERELYDLAGDPYELVNVAGAPQHAGLQASMAAELAALRTAPPHDVFPAVSISDAQVLEGNEGSTLLEFTVSLSAASLEGASVRASTVDGTAVAPEDYQSAVETFTFDPDETEKPFLVTVNGDTSIETDEIVGVVLDQLVGLVAADMEATGTITDDDDVPAVSAGDVTVVEGDDGFTDATFTLSLSHTSGAEATVSFATADGSAVAPDDYDAASGEVTFEPGQLEQNVTIHVTGDAVAEPDETFSLELSAPSGAILGDATGTALILDDDVPVTLAVDDVAVTEGNGGTTEAVFTVSLTPASTDPIAVSWSTADGTAVAPADYAQSAGTVTFAPGETSKTIPVQVVGDVLFEAQETFVVDLTSEDAEFSDAQGLGSIDDDDLAPSIAIADVTVNEGTGSPTIATFVVTLSAPSGAPASVQYGTANGNAKAPGDYTAAAGALMFAAGETSKTIEISVIGDATAERTENFFVNLSSPVGATLADAQGRCTILSDD
jgi:arylsulfatase A-like enzyme